MYKLDKLVYLASVLKHDPFELIRLAGIAINTAKYRYVVRCAGRGSIVGRHTEIINASRVHIGQKVLLPECLRPRPHQ